MDPEKHAGKETAAVQDGYRSSDIVDEDVGSVTKPQGTLNRDLKNRHMQSMLHPQKRFYDWLVLHDVQTPRRPFLA